jgi:hypothetical protein
VGCVTQVDLDLGNYERFLDLTLTKDNNITTGKIYQVPPSLTLFLSRQNRLLSQDCVQNCLLRSVVRDQIALALAVVTSLRSLYCCEIMAANYVMPTGLEGFLSLLSLRAQHSQCLPGSCSGLTTVCRKCDGVWGILYATSTWKFRRPHNPLQKV